MKLRSLAITLGLALVIGAGCTKDKTPGTTTPGGNTQPPNPCGDGHVAGLEMCDGTAIKDNATCATYNLGSGALACTSDCTLSFAGCQMLDLCQANGWNADILCHDCENMGGAADPTCAAHCGADGVCVDFFNAITGKWTCEATTGAADPDCGACGNGVIDGNELCDGTAFATDQGTCAAYGYVAGSLSCSAECTPVFTACTDHECGNGIIEGAEACDSRTFGGKSCASQGFYGGPIACTSDCQLDTTGCVPFGTADYTPFYQAYCGLLVRCEATLGRMVPDEATCEARLPAALPGACMAGVPPASQSAVNDCASFLSSASCDIASGNQSSTLPDSCFETIIGQAPAQADQPCTGLCASGLTCIATVTSGGLCGVCKPLAQLNDPCGFVGSDYVDCDKAFYCDNQSNTCANLKANTVSCTENSECASDFCKSNVCTAAIASGAPCTANDHCAEAFQTCVGGHCSDHVEDGGGCTIDNNCMMDSLCVGGICTSYPVCAARTVGEGCTASSDCTQGAYCANYRGGVAGECAAYVALGGVCAGQGDCDPAAYCDLNARPSPVCATKVGVGGSCAAGQSCIAGATCDYLGDQTCKPPAAVGEPCSSFLSCVPVAFCLRGTGATGTCTAKYGSGHACTGSQECASGLCDADTSKCLDTTTCG